MMHARPFRWPRKCLELDFFCHCRVFANQIAAVYLDIADDFRLTGHWPEDFDPINCRGLSKTDFLPKRGSTKAPATAYHTINLSFANGHLRDDLNTRAEGRP